ncbi:MAG: hypothetical protein UR81_C0008G0001, partial [Candidatus Levybacteria bacterium GW2011_GWB1_35_5]
MCQNKEEKEYGHHDAVDTKGDEGMIADKLDKKFDRDGGNDKCP